MRRTLSQTSRVCSMYCLCSRSCRLYRGHAASPAPGPAAPVSPNGIDQAPRQRFDRYKWRQWHLCLNEAADDAAEAEVRDECLALQRGARARRGVVGAEPLRDGRALVGEPIRRADGVGHDLGGDRADVVVGHLQCLARQCRASRPAAAAAAAASSSASATAAASAAAAAVAAASLAASRALHAAATRAASSAATSRARSAAARLAASCFASASASASAFAARLAASCFASRWASCCASSSLSHRARASAPKPPSRTWRGTVASAASSAASLPPAMAARSAASAGSAADAAGWGAAEGGGAGAAACGAPFGSSPAASAWPAFFFFLDFFEETCPLACSAASPASSSSIAASARAASAASARAAHAACVACIACGAKMAIAPSTTESTIQDQASGTTAHKATPRPSERHDACCRMSSAVAVWPLSSASCRALSVGPGSQQGPHARLVPLVSDLHQGGGVVDVLQVRVGRVLQQNEHGGEVAVVRSSHERGAAEAAWQVDARASLQQLPHHLQLAVARGGVQQAEGCGLTPLDHHPQLASPRRLVDLEGQRGAFCPLGLVSVQWGGKRGGGRLWRRRCVLPDELCGGRMALVLGVLQSGEAVYVEQLGVGLGSQQGLHARLLPSDSSLHQGGPTPGILLVRIGRVLQEEEHGGEVAAVRSSHERGEAEAGLQVDARASLQQLPYHLQLAVARGGVQQGCGCGLAIFSWSRAERVDRPSLAQPVGHLLQLASPGRVVDLEMQRGGRRAHRGLAIVRWGGRRGGGRLRWRRCVLPDEPRGGRLALGSGVMQGGVAVAVEQLGVGLGSQQRLHARLLPLLSGHHQGGEAVAGLQVGVGRVLQEEEQG
eukprot:scaffold10665_cov67-Phaeocystis_antarctica.AAC.4